MNHSTGCTTLFAVVFLILTLLVFAALPMAGMATR